MKILSVTLFKHTAAATVTLKMHTGSRLHCYKTEGEIPVHTHDDAGRQRSTTGKYFPYESGVNTCFAPAVFNTSGIFP
jgi:hypothetical protein